MVTITPQQIKALSPKCDAVLVAQGLSVACTKFGIETDRELRHFIANLMVESAGFNRLEENLNYSAQRLMVVWPNRFPTLAVANLYAHQPEKLANRVYAGRMGNTLPTSGWKFRGRGYIQLTGYDNYKKASEGLQMDLVNKPDLVATHAVAAKTAAWYWTTHGCSHIVAKDNNETVLKSIYDQLRLNEDDDAKEARIAINGGTIGLDEVKKQLLRTGSVWPN